MKVLVAGDGSKVPDICNVFSSAKLVVVSSNNSIPFGKLIKKDPASLDLKKNGLDLTKEDLVVVVEDEEEKLRESLENLVPQSDDIPIIAITSKSAKKLRKYFPSVVFKPIGDMFKSEFKNLVARTETLKKIAMINEIVLQKPKAVILIWGSPDPDAMASAFALKYLIRNTRNDAKIIYMRDFSRPENIAMKILLKIPMEQFRPGDLTDSVVLIVDAQQTFFSESSEIAADIVIDHHPITKSIEYKFSDIRPLYGATATILAEYLLTVEKTIPKQIATALYYGLIVDTNNLSRNASDADIDAFRRLKKLTDENIVRAIELSQMPIVVLDYFGLALSSKKVAGNIIFSYLGEIKDVEVCPYIADFFMRISGISWVIVGCRSGRNLYLIFRSDGFRNDVGDLASALFGSYGQAGGHRTMARAEFPVEKIQNEITDTTDHTIEKWLLTRLAVRLKALNKV